VTLTVSARNFGPIVDGSVELKPFTVFIGPNNTGKSFMSTLIYATQIYSRPLRRLSSGLVSPSGHMLDPKLLADLRRELTKYLKGPDPDATQIFSHLPPRIHKILRDMVRIDLEGYAYAVTSELERSLGGTIQDLIRVTPEPDGPMVLSITSGRAEWAVRIESAAAETIKHEILHVPPTKDIIQLGNQAAIDVLNTYFEPVSRNSDEDFDVAEFFNAHEDLLKQLAEDVAYAIVSNVAGSLHSRIFADFPANRYYLPAARSGIMQSHKSLAAILVRSAPLVGLQQMAVPQLSGIVTDFISQLLNLDLSRSPRRRTDVDLEAVAESLEIGVLHGSIAIKAKPNTYPEILYKVGRLEAPLVRLSSMISELAPVVLYIRYVLARGDHLIIEEPEAHLHPESQRTFARALAALQACNIQITLTTHSDYLLTQLNNFMKAVTIADLSGDKRPESSIPSENVGAYLFEANSEGDGTKIRRLTVSETEGIPDDDFGRVTEAIYNEAADLENRLAQAEVQGDEHN